MKRVRVDVVSRPHAGVPVQTKRIVVPLLRTRYLAWPACTVALTGAGLMLGTPHLRVSYVWNGSESAPIYHSCDYQGLHAFRITPSDGKCPLFVLASPKGRP